MHAAGLIVFLALTGALADVPQAAPQPPQATPPAPQAEAAAPKPQAEAAAPKPQENYTYDPAGRRDPFINLLGTGTEARQVSKKGEGPSGMTVAEISVRGVMQSRNGLIAMVQGPDNKTYIVHPGDKLLDGAIKSITPQGLVIEQAVNDPLSVVKQREVRKLLRGIEDAK
jgi:type IV pilus assembly protein PilP